MSASLRKSIAVAVGETPQVFFKSEGAAGRVALPAPGTRTDRPQTAGEPSPNVPLFILDASPADAEGNQFCRQIADDGQLEQQAGQPGQAERPVPIKRGLHYAVLHNALETLDDFHGRFPTLLHFCEMGFRKLAGTAEPSPRWPFRSHPELHN